MRLVAYTDNVQLGGADLSLRHLLARLDGAADVSVVAVHRAIGERVASGRPGASVHVVRPPRNGHDVGSLREHIAALRALHPDVVHVNLASPFACQYAIAAAATLRRARVVAVYQLPVPPVSGAQLRAKRLTSLRVDAHVGVGERTSREIETLLSLPAGSVRTIHNGVPDEPLEPAPRPVQGPLIGVVGRLERQKGVDVLLRALPDVPGAGLWIVGGGGERPALERLAAELGVADRVTWGGWDDDARRIFGAVDVVAVPSRFEGFPLVVLEALLARSAVVAADVGSVAEAVRDGETGLLVPPERPAELAAALRQALGDEGLRRNLGDAGRRLVVERFTADAMTRGFEALYAELRSG